MNKKGGIKDRLLPERNHPRYSSSSIGHESLTWHHSGARPQHSPRPAAVEILEDFIAVMAATNFVAKIFYLSSTVIH